MANPNPPAPSPSPVTRTDFAGGSIITYQQALFLDWESRRSPSTTLTTADSIQIKGPLDRNALTAAIRQTLERQEALRLGLEGNGRSSLCSVDAVPIGYVDLRGQSSEALQRVVDEQCSICFRMDGSPLIRFMLAQTGDDEHRLIQSYHFAANDPKRGYLVLTDLLSYYNSILDKSISPPGPLPFRFVDYVAWERDWFTKGGGRPAVEAARARMAGAVPCELPTDRPRPIKTAAPVIVDFGIEGDVWDRFTKVTRTLGVWSIPAIAVFAAGLSHIGHMEDIPFISPLSPRLPPEFDGVAGRYTRQVAARMFVKGDPPLSDLAKGARDVLRAGSAAVPAALVYDVPGIFDHPLGRIVLNMPEWDPGPKDDPKLPDVPGLVIRWMRMPTKKGARSDLAVRFHKTDGAIRGQLFASADLFDKPRVEAWADVFLSIFKKLDLNARVSEHV